MGLMFTAVQSSASAVVAPVLNSLTVSLSSGGLCTGKVCTTSASITVTLTASNPNDTLYACTLYENGNPVATPSTGGGSYTKTFTGYTTTGGAPQINPSLYYQALLTLKSTGTTVQILNASTYPYTNTFGTCGGPV